MADLAQLESALIKADAAGDAVGARVLAGEIKRIRNANKIEEPKPQAQAPFVPSGDKTSGWVGGIVGYDPKALGITPAENIAGHPVTRLALGAASPFLGAAQVASEAVGATGVSERLKHLEEMKRRGMGAMGAGDTDVIGGVGTMASPAFLGLARALPAARTVAGRVGQGTLVGGVAGATAPVSDAGVDYWATKGGQTILGLGVGAAIPGGIEAGKAGVRGAKNIADMFTQGGAGRILTRYQKRVIGDEQVPAVVDKLRTAPEYVPGAKPTAAEAVADLPAGSPIVAHQKITATTPGGISAQFGQRKLDQLAARKAAEEARDVATRPMRETAIQQANLGGVQAERINAGIDAMLAKPGQRASDVVQRTLGAVKEKIASLKNEAGFIDAEDLYTVRKELGNTIKTHAKETANWDKRLTGGLERAIQKHIDDAVEAAGGTGWKAYLAEYSRLSKNLEADKVRRLMSQRPAQRTELGGGVNVAEETRVALPQMLSRPMMATNFVLRKLGAGVETRLDPEAARRYLNPDKLADALAQLPPAQRFPVLQELMQLGRVPVMGGAIAESAQITGQQQ